MHRLCHVTLKGIGMSDIFHHASRVSHASKGIGMSDILQCIECVT